MPGRRHSRLSRMCRSCARLTTCARACHFIHDGLAFTRFRAAMPSALRVNHGTPPAMSHRRSTCSAGARQRSTQCTSRLRRIGACGNRHFFTKAKCWESTKLLVAAHHTVCALARRERAHTMHGRRGHAGILGTLLMQEPGAKAKFAPFLRSEFS